MRKQRADEYAEMMRHRREEPCRLVYVPANGDRPARVVPVRAAEQPKPVQVAPVSNERATPDLERTAYEEAGHAVADDELGVHVTSLCVRKDGSGAAWAEHAADITLPVVGKVHRKAITLWAGMAAQRQRYGNHIVSEPDMDNLRLCTTLLELEGAEAEAFLAETRARAADIVAKRWADVERVAAVLNVVRSLNASEFYQCIGKTAPVTQVRKEMLPIMIRSATLQAAGGDEYDVVFSSGATVRRRDDNYQPYDEELVMTPAAVDLSRLASGRAPFLAGHDSSNLSSVIGVVTSARIENGLGLARIRLSNRDDVKGIAQDVRDKILHSVSVGDRIDTAERIQRAGDVPLLRATRWTPYELSLVSIPADPFASVRGAPKFEAVVRG
ncbi:MAG TPA: hypothetical protein VH558_04200 [Pseudolabrys sp.]